MNFKFLSVLHLFLFVLFEKVEIFAAISMYNHVSEGFIVFSKAIVFYG